MRSLTIRFQGKSTFFVANQSNLESVPSDKLSSLEEELKTLEEDNKVLAADVKAASTGV
jgi:26S proteasome regulatory subunit (ATPase 3-interacting protein)